jgi:RNA polymerase sigma-70 factor (ECF subfamily)
MGRVPEWRRELSAISQPRAESVTAAGAPLGPKERSKRIEDLFEAHNNALIRFLTYKLKSPQEAKEVAQEAYVRILQLDSADGVSHLQAFLFKTAANLAADRIKTGVRRERIDRLEFFDAEGVAPAPEIGLAAIEEIENVLAAVEALPAKCRYAFIMHRFHDHAIADVARLMNVSERMVRIYVERAVVFCRKRLLSTGGGS